MYLMTFIKIAKPTYIERMIIMIAIHIYFDVFIYLLNLSKNTIE